MSYRFELRDGIASSFGRIVAEQIDRVLSELQSGDGKPTAIHESRKSLKRVRALLRLARPAIGEQAFKSENARFREIGALFSNDRDRHVLLETARGTAAIMGARHKKPFAAITSELSTAPAPPEFDTKDAAKQAVASLKSARRDVTKLAFSPNSFEALQSGLERSYRIGRRQLRAAYAAPSDEAFHDLRKAVQQHWRHMQVLQRAWPDLFIARLAAARRLSQILGDDHDLAVFVAHLQQSRAAAAADRRVIVRHCRTEQQKLRELAHPLCQQLYAEPAGRFAKRIAVMWHTSVRVAELEAARDKPAKTSRPPAAAKKQSPARKRANKKRIATPPGPDGAGNSRGNTAQSAKPTA